MGVGLAAKVTEARYQGKANRTKGEMYKPSYYPSRKTDRGEEEPRPINDGSSGKRRVESGRDETERRDTVAETVAVGRGRKWRTEQRADDR